MTADHEKKVREILSKRTNTGVLKSREGTIVEFKLSFNKGNTAKYAKTMAAYANNKGGYIIFGIKDSPREIVGLKNDNFDNMNQEQFTEAINALFVPAIDWECGSFILENDDSPGFRIGWIYSNEAENKPIIAVKANEGEKISSGDIFYRYRARTQKIKYAEMNRIIEKRISNEKERLLKLFEVIQKSETANLGIVNYSSGRLTTPYGVDATLDQKIVTQVLKKAKFIKEGSFNETTGMPVIKVTGNIDLAEEVPVPEGEPDKTHPYIQRQLAEKLGISTQDLYALIWYYKMKEAKKYHLEITVSRSSTTHKFSEFALQFLREKLDELRDDEEEFNKIRLAYKNRNKVEV